MRMYDMWRVNQHGRWECRASHKVSGSDGQAGTIYTAEVIVQGTDIDVGKAAGSMSSWAVWLRDQQMKQRLELLQVLYGSNGAPSEEQVVNDTGEQAGEDMARPALSEEQHVDTGAPGGGHDAQAVVLEPAMPVGTGMVEACLEPARSGETGREACPTAQQESLRWTAPRWERHSQPWCERTLVGDAADCESLRWSVPSGERHGQPWCERTWVGDTANGDGDGAQDDPALYDAHSGGDGAQDAPGCTQHFLIFDDDDADDDDEAAGRSDHDDVEASSRANGDAAAGPVTDLNAHYVVSDGVVSEDAWRTVKAMRGEVAKTDFVSSPEDVSSVDRNAHDEDVRGNVAKSGFDPRSNVLSGVDKIDHDKDVRGDLEMSRGDSLADGVTKEAKWCQEVEQNPLLPPHVFPSLQLKSLPTTYTTPPLSPRQVSNDCSAPTLAEIPTTPRIPLKPFVPVPAAGVEEEGAVEMARVASEECASAYPEGQDARKFSGTTLPESDEKVG